MRRLKIMKKIFTPVKNIDIEVEKETGIITMTNDGNGIDIVKHQNINYGFQK